MSHFVPINVKASPDMCGLIDQAAKLTHRNRTEFVLEAAAQRAQEVILDQTLITLDPDRFQKFIDALDSSPASNPRLRRVLRTKTPWE